jgi:hypothetical protein
MGLSCYFRVELILLPAVIFLILWIASGRFLKTCGQIAVLGIAMLIAWTPWLVWTRVATGEVLLTSSNGGGTMYEGLGEDPKNPWGVGWTDGWLMQDSIQRGFQNAFAPDGDKFYKRQFLACVREHPSVYAAIVLKQRLPLALVPPYGPVWRTDEDYAAFSFAKCNMEEGLTRWQAIRKYPGKILEHYWPILLMIPLSFLLTLGMAATIIHRRREWRKLAWVLIPWLYVVWSICLVKSIEPKNVSSVLVFDIAAIAWTAAVIWDRRKAARQISSPPPVSATA